MLNKLFDEHSVTNNKNEFGAEIISYSNWLVSDGGTRSTEQVLHMLVLATQYTLDERAPGLLGASSLAQDRLLASKVLAQWLWLSGRWKQDAIARYLNSQGQLTTRGRPWSQSTVSAGVRELANVS